MYSKLKFLLLSFVFLGACEPNSVEIIDTQVPEKSKGFEVIAFEKDLVVGERLFSLSGLGNDNPAIFEFSDLGLRDKSSYRILFTASTSGPSNNVVLYVDYFPDSLPQTQYEIDESKQTFSWLAELDGVDALGAKIRFFGYFPEMQDVHIEEMKVFLVED